MAILCVQQQEGLGGVSVWMAEWRRAQVEDLDFGHGTHIAADIMHAVAVYVVCLLNR